MSILNILLGIIQFLIISYILIKEVTRKSPSVFLWATLFIMFGLPHLITTIINDFEYPAYITCEASLFVVMFCLFYLLARRKSECAYIEVGSKYEIEDDTIKNSVLEAICFFAFLLSFSIVLISTIRSMGSIWNASWASVRSIERDYVSINGFATRIIFAFSGFSLYFFLTKRRKLAVAVLLLFMFYVFIKKSRVDVLPVLIFFVSLYLIKIKQIKLKHILIGMLLGVAVIYIVYGLRAFRWLGSNSDAIANFSWEYINRTVLRFLSERDGELGLRQHFYYFIYKGNQFPGFNRGATYIRMLLVFLPGQFTFGLKPESFDLTMGRAIGMAAGGSMHPTLFGDCFGNLWWFGIALGFFWALIANLADQLINRQKYPFYKIMIYFVASYSFVVIGRGSVYNGFQVSAWGILFILGLRFLNRKMERIHIRFGLKGQ